MLRWIVTVVGIVIAAGAGLFIGYVRWGTQAPQLQRVEEHLEATKTEAAALRDQKQDLERRLDQVAKEQERLAQENEILRKQQTTEQLLTGRGGELPNLPPK